MKPKRYLPDARTMISVGLAINEASCDLIARSVREQTVPASCHSCQLFTMTSINPQLDQLAYHGARFLERRGFRAYPFPANIPHVLKPTEQYPGGPGDISHKHVAVACGLGQIGGKTVVYARLVGWKCRWGCSGMLTCTSGYKDIPMPKTEPTAEALLRYKTQMDPWQECSDLDCIRRLLPAGLDHLPCRPASTRLPRAV